MGVILPKDRLQLRLQLKEGDQVFAGINADGLHLTPYNPEFEVAMEAFGRTRWKYRNALRQLTK